MSQFDLFGEASPPPPVAPPPFPADLQALGRRLPAQLHLGTSSWSFPGWRGLVYDHEYPASRLSRDGLAAYGQHPLLRSVGVDSSFYQPVDAERFTHWAAQVPAGFRFLVKAARHLTTPWETDGRGRPGGPNRFYLDPDFALRRVIEPMLEGLQHKAGPLLFQFPPLGSAQTDAPRRFAEALYRFLDRLPAGPLYGVEVRNPELQTTDLAQALHHGNARPVLSVHPRLPDWRQQKAWAAESGAGPLLIRWMLRPDRRYQEARADFAPFDQLQAPDPRHRELIADACRQTLQRKQPVYVIANNKAEGSSPLSLQRLAETLTDLS